MAKLEGIEVEIGLTAEIRGTYIKPTARVKVAFEGEESKDPKVVKETWDKAWNMVTNEVERIISDYAKGE